MSEEKSHADIYRRVEKVEIDVAVLDSKTNRLHEDMQRFDKRFDKVETQINLNGKTANDTKTKVDALPKLMTILIMGGGLILTVGMFIIERLT